MSATLASTADLLTDGDWVESKDQDPDGTVRLVQLADIGVGCFLDRSQRFLTRAKANELKCTYLVPGDILIARMPDPIGRACMFPDLGRPCVTAVDVAILRARSGVNATYLIHWINSPFFRARVLEHAKGATRQRISGKNLAGLPVPLPSLERQEKVAAYVDECLSRVDELRALRAESSVQAAAVFPAVLRARFERIASHHSARALEEVADIIGGQSLPKGTDLDPGEDRGVLLFKVGDMNLDGNELLAVTAREYALKGVQGRVVPPGSVVFPKRGGAIATNKKRLLGRPAILDPNLMGVVPRRSVLRPEYLLAWFENIDLRELSNGGVIPQLNKKDLSPLKLPIPSLAEQDSILSTVEEARGASRELHAKLAAWEADTELVHQGVLRKAFADDLQGFGG